MVRASLPSICSALRLARKARVLAMRVAELPLAFLLLDVGAVREQHLKQIDRGVGALALS